MTVPPPLALEFPAMLHGPTSAALREVRTQGKRWAREYVKTGVFTQPRRMLSVPPGELLIMDPGAEPDVIPLPRWRVHLLFAVYMQLDDGVPEEEHRRMDGAFDSFCLNTPWGALFHAVSPYPPRSAERMAQKLAALLRFWDVLQGPRYAFWPDRPYTLEDLVEDIYRPTLEAWCPGGPTSVREQLTLAVERMARATREDCVEAVLRVIPALVEIDTGFKHPEVLSDPSFLHERLATLPPEDFEDFSSAYKYTVTMQLAAWDRQLGRH